MTNGLPNAALRARIEQQLADAGLQVTVESSDGALILNGVVDSEEARQAAEDIAAQLAPDARIDNQLEVGTLLPTNVEDFAGHQPSAELSDTVAGELDPDFTNQSQLGDSSLASGPDSAGPTTRRRGVTPCTRRRSIRS